ncbi:hypothetical protein [Schumannella soli]|uniref:Uncharacterized protein n=1 Tax=Schumannella soli TaxID=2590779 RepID=A0A506XYY7_9MICO|nr:hypothetical protein [Schumannella soli]TPW74610.1 hypothetical protein FJ657_13565 [Schumannella soli]
MLQQQVSLVRGIAAFLGLLVDGAADLLGLSLALLAVLSLAGAVVVAALVLLRVVGTHRAPPRGAARPRRPQLLLAPASSHPDARGHARPRAPGALLPAV